MPLPLHPRTRQELDRRGAANIRAILDNPEWTGAGQNAEVNLRVAGVPNPERAQVELWLREKEQAAQRSLDCGADAYLCRHRCGWQCDRCLADREGVAEIETIRFTARS